MNFAWGCLSCGGAKDETQGLVLYRWAESPAPRAAFETCYLVTLGLDYSYKKNSVAGIKIQVLTPLLANKSANTV